MGNLHSDSGHARFNPGPNLNNLLTCLRSKCYTIARPGTVVLEGSGCRDGGRWLQPIRTAAVAESGQWIMSGESEC